MGKQKQGKHDGSTADSGSTSDSDAHGDSNSDSDSDDSGVGAAEEVEVEASDSLVIVTTHVMDEAEALCSEVAFATHGVWGTAGSPKELCARHGCGYLICIGNLLGSVLDADAATSDQGGGEKERQEVDEGEQ